MYSYAPPAVCAGISSERDLVALACALGAAESGGPLTASERALCRAADLASAIPEDLKEDTGSLILQGGDPLGDILCTLRPGAQRRSQGAFYTPSAVVSPMVDWVLDQSPARVVDPGCGSGRFTAELLRRSRSLEIWALDLDPLQTLITRAILAVLGARNAHVLQGDYLDAELPACEGRTAFISNPPYVRHHDLSPATKAWGAATARGLGHSFSGLAGLHAHFFLATARLGRPGDVGCFITSAEWLDVGYGQVIRSLLLDGLGGNALHVIDPSAEVFEDAQTTAVVTCFRLGSEPAAMRVRRVSSAEQLRALELGYEVPRAEFATSARWTALTKPVSPEEPAGSRLGELVHVHRGMVTGANDYFVLTRSRASALGILPWCVPAITEGREIIDSHGLIRDAPERKLLFRPPREIDREASPELDAYLRLGESPAGDPRAVARRYISSHRRPWWYLGAQEPPPIVASYMARQAPVFALNRDGLALINIGHGLYPKRKMSWRDLRRLVHYLNGARESFRGLGRTYQGGLEKFEPREMEALPIAFVPGEADNG
ncbi:MAG TPA: class I SAM-dependent methyltransferase [Chloroflexota bacterium]|nr:class I SAM-dependent methyltransferase [Chloroflexota bacterium]